MINRTKLYYYLQKVLIVLIFIDVPVFILKTMNILTIDIAGNFLAWIYSISIIPGTFIVILIYLVLGLDINNQMTEAGEAIGIIINICLYLIVKEKKMKYLKNDKKQ